MPDLLIVNPQGSEKRVSLGSDDCLIGRDSGVSIRLAGSKVSRKHARIYRKGGSYFIEDLERADTMEDVRREIEAWKERDQ